MRKKHHSRYFWLCACFIFCLQIGFSQIGGRTVYEFLSLPTSARATALGDHLITVFDDDLSAAHANPASLNKLTDKNILLSHDFYLADISRGYLAYGFEVPKWGINMHSGLQYINYGDFQRADELGQLSNEFKVSEYALTVGASRALYDKVNVGVNMRLINSQFDSYSSSGIAFDAGITYHNDEKKTVFSLVLKNMGGQFSAYNNEKEPIPFDIQAGFSRRLEHLPFRFSIVADQLQHWDVTYDDPSISKSENIFQDQSAGDSNGFIDNLFRHLTFSGEFYLGANEVFMLRGAYRYLRSQELGLTDFRNLAGFSFGFGIKVKDFKFDYGLSKFNVKAVAHHLTIGTNLSTFKSNGITN